MKRCTEIEQILTLYREGERSPEEAKLVREHTEQCAECKARVEQFSQTDSVMREVRDAVAQKSRTVDVTGSVMAAIRASSVGKAQTGRTSNLDALLEWLIPAVALPVVALLLLFVVQESIDYTRINATQQRLNKASRSGISSRPAGVPQSISGIREALVAAGEYATADERKLIEKSGRVLAALTKQGSVGEVEGAKTLSEPQLRRIMAVLERTSIGPAEREAMVAEGSSLLQEIDKLEHTTKGIQ